MLSSVYYYIDDRGNNPVKAFITSLPLKDRAKVFAYIEELKQQGHNLRHPLADYLGHGIYELRPKHNRVFYLFFMKENAVLVHAIKKETDKIPKNDSQLCIKRKNQVEREHRNIQRLL
ncbi:MAG: type II toxin-antitoxin system RelE/ParE family toxin [Candidatus Omnitrophota bacterium]